MTTLDRGLEQNVLRQERGITCSKESVKRLFFATWYIWKCMCEFQYQGKRIMIGVVISICKGDIFEYLNTKGKPQMNTNESKRL